MARCRASDRAASRYPPPLTRPRPVRSTCEIRERAPWGQRPCESFRRFRWAGSRLRSGRRDVGASRREQLRRVCGRPNYLSRGWSFQHAMSGEYGCPPPSKPRGPYLLGFTESTCPEVLKAFDLQADIAVLDRLRAGAASAVHRVRPVAILAGATSPCAGVDCRAGGGARLLKFVHSDVLFRSTAGHLIPPRPP